MSPWPAIPDDVVAWFRRVFADANRRVCERLVNLPNIRETSLDDGLIEAPIPDSNDDRVRYFLERRSGPIGPALAASITLPDEV